MSFYHFAVAWDWEYDRDFVLLLERAVQREQLTSYSITHHNVVETIARLRRGELRFGSFLDRAGDGDEKFPPLAHLIAKSSTFFINRPDHVQHAADKATMHLEFLTKGIDVPFTIIISPYNKKKEIELRLSDIARLGWPFIIKPANTTGGGIGVVLNAASLKDVIETRQHHKNDKYLLQERIVPTLLDGRKAWFRVFHIFGTSIPCWWDDETHVYQHLTGNKLERFHLQPLLSTTQKIAEVSKLEFFSTEIAVTNSQRIVVVDYVNEICDMRLQSKHTDGVPDSVVEEICTKTAHHLKASFSSEEKQT
ncbi:MAG: hypothetical protein C4326_05360 [Ignavibacteria bacterium]